MVVGVPEAPDVAGPRFDRLVSSLPAVSCGGQRLASERIGVRFNSSAEPASPCEIWLSDAQLAWRNSGRSTPLASWIENSVRALWSSHASHHR